MRDLASLSLDLDNQWSYMKTYGCDGWQSFPSYFDRVVPRVLELLGKLDLKITVFVVGQDAALDKNRDALRSISDAGHEIGNHSFSHEPWLHTYEADAVDSELARAEEAIEAATGHRPTGFRGPGFSISERILAALARRGYAYDATVFPNLLNPVARLYFFAITNLPEEEKQKRRELFGTFSDALMPLRPYRWSLGNASLTEVPVTTMPLFKVPIHFSYLMYIAGYSWAAARLYFALTLRLCRLTGVQPSLLLHPPDFLGAEDVGELAFFPGMKVAAKDKIAFLERALTRVVRDHAVVTVGEHARQAALAPDTRLRVHKAFG